MFNLIFRYYWRKVIVFSVVVMDVRKDLGFDGSDCSFLML